MKSLLAVICMLAQFGIAYANVCSGPDIKAIQRPIDLSHPEKTFEFKYQIKIGIRPDAPTIVHLNGGPGQTGIDDKKSSLSYNEINFDLRGIGCNKLATEKTNDFFTTETFAEDVVAVIKELKLSNFVLEGVSYGTILGTVVAHKLEQTSFKPKAIILEGTVGVAYHEDLRKGFQPRFESFFENTSSEIRSLLSQTNPLGYSPEQWGTFFGLMSTIGFLKGNEGKTIDSLDSILILAVKEETLPKFREYFSATSLNFDPEQQQLYEHVMCKEISPGGHEIDIRLSNEEGKIGLKPLDGDRCSRELFTHPFDTRQYPYSINTYYFSGEIDPMTPMWQTAEHIIRNPHSYRAWINVPKGGHNSLRKQLKDCRAKIYEDILEHNGTKLSNILSKECIMTKDIAIEDVLRVYPKQ